MAGPFIGRVFDRYGVRRVITIGGLVTGLGFVLVSLTNTLWYFYLLTLGMRLPMELASSLAGMITLTIFS